MLQTAWKRIIYIVLMHGEKAKDSSRTTARELQKIVESRSQKTVKKKKKGQTAPTSPRVAWEGFKKNDPRSSNNKLQ